MLPDTGFQLSVELTRLPAAVGAAVSGVKDIIGFARALKKSGSDIVVEADLASIFGQLKIDPQLDADFRSTISQDTRIVPLHSTCALVLKKGPDETVTRASKKESLSYGYMATVIQLSYFGWQHNRTELASALGECIDRRFRLLPKFAVPNPGFEGIMKTLECCNAQTSCFDWTPIVADIDLQIRQHFSYYHRDDFNGLVDQQSFRSRRMGISKARFITGLSTTLLLAAMDSLHIVQTFPEDRTMIIPSEEGAIPIVVWAHKILGLTVVIRSSSHEDLFFGSADKAHVTIKWRDERSLAFEVDAADILVLDPSQEVVLRYGHEDHFAVGIQTEERHLLENFGSTHLRRFFKQHVSTMDDSPLYADFIELIFALVYLMSRKIRRESYSDNIAKLNQYPLDVWRIENTIEVVFKDFIDRVKFDDLERLSKELRYKPSEVLLPSSASSFLTSIKKAGEDIAIAERRLRQLTNDLSYFIFVFSHVDQVTKCSKVPLKLALDIATDGEIQEQMNQGIRSLQLQSCTMFFYVARRLLGYNIKEQDQDRSFLFSDFGWSIHLNCMNIGNDQDPAATTPHLLYLKDGIPTMSKTGEQKPRIGDGNLPDSFRPLVTKCDKGQRYNPRCEIGVEDCREYWISRDREFLVSVRFLISRQKDNGRPLEVHSTYRQMHSVLWAVCVTKQACCAHSIKLLDSATLGLNNVTVKGCEWPDEDFGERICIVLVRGDKKARWLAVQEASLVSGRDTMLRGEDCCENCALEAVSELPGKWILII